MFRFCFFIIFVAYYILFFYFCNLNKIKFAMKKVLLLVLSCVVLVSASAQGDLFKRDALKNKYGKTLNFRPVEKMTKSTNYNYRLESYATDDGYMDCNFYYDSQRRLVAVYEDIPSEYQLIDSIRYNEQNQLVRLDGYQFIYNQWKHVYYIEYTYNNQGLISSRTNYNNMDGEFEQGGIYEYFYDDNGNLIKSELTMAEVLYTIVEYTYENNRLATEIWSYADFFGQSDEFVQSERLRYTYNAEGKLTLVNYDIYDAGGWDDYATRTYTYNEAGNCTEVHAYDANENETERSIFYYDNRTLSETLMPWNPEMVRPETFSNTNIYTTEEFWTLDANLVLQYMCDYEYTYADIDAVGLLDVEQLPLTLTPNPAENLVMISGLNEGVHQMEIIDLSGRVVMKDNIVNLTLIDLSTLQNGCYLVKVVNNTSVYTAKIIVK